ncbi:MAG: zinc finger domain-containing protein [Promethearchaeota archaeon]
MSYTQNTCNGCGRNIAPYENSVSFSCPNCGDVIIRRCERCRDFAREYKCQKCGFMGP